MKMKHLIFNISLAAVSILTLSSCLKKRATTLDGPGPRNVVEFLNTGANGAGTSSFYPLYSQDLGNMMSGESKFFNINVSYSGEFTAPSDMTVQVSVDQASLDRFNDENGTDYEIPPSSVFSFPTTFVIKKGQRLKTDSMKVTLSPDYDFDASYAIPLKITSVSPSATISANFGSAVYSLTIRNQFDGVYSVVDGFMQRYSNATDPTVGDALNGSLAGNPDISMVTVGKYTVELQSLTWHGGGGVGGINNLRATVDPVTNQVTMASLQNATLADTPGLVNSYDPGTQTFTLNFSWNPAGPKRVVTGLILKYKGSR